MMISNTLFSHMLMSCSVKFTFIKLLLSKISYPSASATDIDVNSDVVCFLVLALLLSSFRSFRHSPKRRCHFKTV